MPKRRRQLARVRQTPDLVAMVPRLQPDALHQLIQARSLEDSTELVALATPAQLAHILDADLWRARTPGGDETLDADRFGVWIAVLVQCGAAVASEKLKSLDIELVVAGLAQHVSVFDIAAVSSYVTIDGQDVEARAVAGEALSEIGGYVLSAKQMSAWEPIVELLTELEADHREHFDSLMRKCVVLSSAGVEKDGLDDLLNDNEQQSFDVASARNDRRSQLGYVGPVQAGAFLRSSRDVRLHAERPQPSAIAQACFREMSRGATHDAPASAGALSPIVSEGVAPRATIADELAFLANAILSGSAILGRPFTASEARDSAFATCKLGMENWPPHWGDRDLITAFQAGWTILNKEVCIYAAEKLIAVLADIRCTDREVQRGLQGLRRQLARHTRRGEPWRARNALDVLLMLDAASWAALCGILDEHPVLHGAANAQKGCKSIGSADFSFISENSQIAAVREFMESLPTVLTA